jgi:N-acetyl-gamma-glutamylphosphate reductase
MLNRYVVIMARSSSTTPQHSDMSLVFLSWFVLTRFEKSLNQTIQIPEINEAAILDSRLIANPNCTTAIAAMVLWPIHKEFGIKTLIISTYQAASGAGIEVIFFWGKSRSFTHLLGN